MSSPRYWKDPSRYVLIKVGDGLLPIDLSAGGGAVVIEDDEQADAAKAELLAAGCPVVESHKAVTKLVLESRGNTRWDYAGMVGLWQDRWGGIWLKSNGPGAPDGAVRLGKYEARGLAEHLGALANNSDAEE